MNGSDRDGTRWIYRRPTSTCRETRVRQSDVVGPLPSFTNMPARSLAETAKEVGGWRMQHSIRMDGTYSKEKEKIRMILNKERRLI